MEDFNEESLGRMLAEGKASGAIRPLSDLTEAELENVRAGLVRALTDPKLQQIMHDYEKASGEAPKIDEIMEKILPLSPQKNTCGKKQ